MYTLSIRCEIKSLKVPVTVLAYSRENLGLLGTTLWPIVKASWLIVTVLPDSGDKYFSKGLWDYWHIE